MNDLTVEVRLVPERHRFEIIADGARAGLTTFHDIDGVRTFFHTEIDPQFEGHGLGSRLIREALDQTRAAGLRVVPKCPFVRAFIESHHEYADLIAA